MLSGVNKLLISFHQQVLKKMNYKIVLLSALLLCFASYSLQAKFVDLSLNGVLHLVAESGSCLGGAKFECSGDVIKMEEFDDNDCKGEPRSSFSFPCLKEYCKCSGKIPKGHRIEMYNSGETCSDKYPPIIAVITKKEACFSFDDLDISMLKRDMFLTTRDNIMATKLIIKKDEFEVFGYESSSCEGEPELLYKGTVKTCFKNEEGQGMRVLSSGLSLNISMMILSLSAIISMLILF